MHVFDRSCETLLAASSYQQQQVQDGLLPLTSKEGNMDAQRTLALAVHTAVMGSVLTSAQKQAFVSGGLPCIHRCDSGVLMDFSSRTSTPGPAKAGCSAAVVQQQVGAHLEDSTSPLSSDSFAVIDGVLTPCAADSISVARVGGKRTYDALQQHQQVQFKQTAAQQQQAAALAQLRQHTASQATELQTKHAVLLIKQRQAQQQRQQQQQRHVLQQQAQQASGFPPVQQQQHLQTALAAGQHKAVVHAIESAASSNRLSFTAAAQLQQQQLLVPQGSGNSTSSSYTCGTAAPRVSAASVLPQYVSAACVLPQYVQQQQQQQLVSSAGMLPQQVTLLGSVSSLTTTSSTSSSSSSCASLLASYLQQQQQQRPPKRAATQAAVAALLSATAASQARAQQHRALLQPLAAASSSNNLQGLAAQAAAAVGPYRTLLSSNHGTGLLTWAGQVLNCQLQDAYLLAQHIFKRVAGRLDDMLLISLGVTVPVNNITMLVSLWVATKLEGHRRQVAGCSKLAAALQLLPWAVTSVELHVMQLMNWQPYAGWALRSQEPSCVVVEY